MVSLGAWLRKQQMGVQKSHDVAYPSKSATSIAENILSLDCPECDSPEFGSDEKGHFLDTDPAPCSNCGALIWITPDDEQCWVTSDFEIADVGQARCTGCRWAGEAHQGKPCTWDCAEAWVGVDKPGPDELVSRWREQKEEAS